MNEDGFTSFLCDHCHTEIEASPDMIGQETECPACGAKLVVPDNRDDGVKRHTADDVDLKRTQAMKSRTIRIELPDL
jgi:DNA-directed RNA polymerase subunit RPC12/RpoP